MSRDVNSYKLASLEGLALKGRFSSRRLRSFEARPGTALDTQQKALEAAATLLRNAGTLSREEVEDVPEEGVSDHEQAPKRTTATEDTDEDGLEDEEGDEEGDPESPQGGVREAINEDTQGEHDEEDGGDDSEEIEDGLPRGGWAAPGRLRLRVPREGRAR